jgi:glycosyltransferase involved in cell wall biosynthesis
MHVLLTGNTTFKIANFREGLVRRLLANGHQVTVCAPPDDYVGQLLGIGCRFIPIKMDRNGTSPLAEMRCLLSIFNALRRSRPNFVFGYTIKNNIYAGLACRVLRIPFVPNVTGLGPAFESRGIQAKLIRTLYRVAFAETKKVFFQNDSDLNTFRAANLVTDSKSHLLPGSGVDLKKFPFSALPDAQRGVRFLMVARLLREKGVGIYAEAAKLVRNQFPHAEFYLLGPLDPDSRSGISQAELDFWVHDGAINYLGSTKNVLPHLQNTHCVVLPTYYREGTPRSLLEAAAVGRPIITTNIPGCRDVVDQTRNGFLVPTKDAQMLAEACIAFLNKTAEQRQAMSEASRAHIARSYDEQIVTNAYFDILDETSSKTT